MQIGDYVRAIPTELSCDVDHRTKEPIPMVGKIIYIHPRRRFCVLEFSFSGIFGETKVREAFKFPIKERGLDKNESNSDYEREGRRGKDNNNRKRRHHTR